MITVSVVVAAYNVEKYINRAVDSILNSTYPHLQVIVVDDGSTDSTGKLLDVYQDERLQVIHTKNQGVSMARNIGLDAVRGEYTLFVDGDDYIDEYMIEEMIKNLVNQDIIETTQFFADDSKSWRKPYQTSMSINGKNLQEEIEACLLLTLAPHSRLYRSVLLKDLRFPQGLVFEDNYFVSMLFPKLTYVTKIDTTHGYYHYKRVGSTTMTFNDKIFDMLAIQKKILESYKANGYYREYFLILEKNAVHDLIYSTIGRKFAHYQGEANLKEKYDEIVSFVRSSYPAHLKNPYLSFKEKMVCRLIMSNYTVARLVQIVVKGCGY